MHGPIGIFDSGLGGLTVFREIRQLLPQEDLLYVGDTARVPYGTKSPETITRYSREICDFLLKQGAKAIVVACNTASALALPVLQQAYPVPLLGVLEPGVQAALRVTQHHKVAVIGTEATIRSQSYERALKQRNPDVQIFSQACPLFVPLVETGWTDHFITRQVAEIYLASWKPYPFDTMILGCTHYPLLKKMLQDLLGSSVNLVDSAWETAQALQRSLVEAHQLKDKNLKGSSQFWATDAPEQMQQLAARFLGEPLVKVGRTNLDLI